MSDVSLEELLKLLEETEEVKEEKSVGLQKDVAHMDKFLNDMGIRSGLDRIPTYVIFYTYRTLWTNTGLHTSDKASKVKFFKTFKKRFVQKRTGKQRVYLLNAEAFDLSREGKLKAKHYDEGYTKRTKNHKERKRKASKLKKESKSKE